MDMYSVIVSVASTVFGAGSVWGVLQNKVKQHTKDIEEVKSDQDDLRKEMTVAVNRLDDKVSKIYDHLVSGKAGH